MARMVAALQELLGFGRSPAGQALARPDPEPRDGGSRPMTGFLATLTDEQRQRALAYDGEENFGAAHLPLRD